MKLLTNFLPYCIISASLLGILLNIFFSIYYRRPGFTSAQKNSLYQVVFEVLTAVVMKSSLFWSITPRDPSKVNRRFGEALLTSSGSKNNPSWFSTLKMEATSYFETLVGFQRTTRRYIAGHGNLQLKT
jgi:hypothetical protein